MAFCIEKCINLKFAYSAIPVPRFTNSPITLQVDMYVVAITWTPFISCILMYHFVVKVKKAKFPHGDIKNPETTQHKNDPKGVHCWNLHGKN